MTDPSRDRATHPSPATGKDSQGNRPGDQPLSSSCENAFAAFFANSLDAMFITAPDGRIFRANPAACRMLGYTEAEIVALGRAGILDANTQLDQALKERREKGRYSGELNFVDKNGRIIPTEVTAAIFTNAEGEERSSVIVRDLTEKKLLKAREEEQKRLHQTLLDALPCVALLLRPGTREIVAMNRAAKDAGCELGKTCFTTWPGFASSCPWCLAPELWASGEPQHLEIEAQGIIWDARWLQVGDDLYIHYAFDITEHKERELALRNHEQFTRTVMDHLPIGLAVNSVDPAVTMLYMNDNFTRFYRTTREALKDVDSFWEAAYEDPDFREEIKARVLADCASGDPRRMIWNDIPIVREGQETHYICAQNIPVLNDKMMLSTVWDVTERIRMQLELQKSEQQYRTLFESMDEGFCVIEILFTEEDIAQDLLVLETNPAFDKHTGLNDSRGKLLSQLLASTSSSWTETLGRIAKTGTPQRFEKHAAALGRWLEVYAFRIGKPEENKVAILLQDISERKKAEADRERLQSQLIQAQRLESVGRLAGGVAHDFNNMLSVIIGFAELALSQIKESDAIHDDLLEIHSAARRSASITEQLLAFARKQIVAPQRLDLNEATEVTLKMLRRLIGENINLEYHPGAALSPILIDPSQLNQILTNLCVNSRDAIGDVGKITIETAMAKRRPHPLATAAATPQEEFVMLSFADTGCGMDEPTVKNIFEPFFTTKEPGKGTGLGLSTIYGIVDQNGGFIEVDSKPGQGTTFKIYFPAQVGSVGNSLAQKVDDGCRGSGETILIVEDELSILRLSRSILEKEGYQVLTASSPQEALRLAEEHGGALHLMITDVVMPEMNGRDLALKMMARFPGLKNLYMSGYTADLIGQHGVLADGEHFLQKPFARRDLLRKVRQVLESAPTTT